MTGDGGTWHPAVSSNLLDPARGKQSRSRSMQPCETLARVASRCWIDQHGLEIGVGIPSAPIGRSASSRPRLQQNRKNLQNPYSARGWARLQFIPVGSCGPEIPELNRRAKTVMQQSFVGAT